MIPTKYASSDMKSAASARNETTRLSALATGLRLMTTAAPNTSIIKAKTQKRNAGMELIGVTECWSNGVRDAHSQSLLHHSNTSALQLRLFLLVPFQNDSVHHAADLE